MKLARSGMLVMSMFALSLPVHAGVIYQFDGYDQDCGQTACSRIAEGTLVLGGDYAGGTLLPDGSTSLQSWQFTNLLTGASYSLPDPYLAGFNGWYGILPAAPGLGDFWIDFGGDSTFFETGLPWGNNPGVTPHWTHLNIEPLNAGVPNIDELAAVLGSIPVSGQYHTWTKLQAIPEPTGPALLMVALLGLAASQLARDTRWRAALRLSCSPDGMVHVPMPAKGPGSAVPQTRR